MRTPLILGALLALAPSSSRAADGSSLEDLKASAFSLPVQELAGLLPDQAAKFKAAADRLSRLENGIVWVKDDMAQLEERARRIIQMHAADSLFQFDLRRLKDDSDRRLADIRRSAADIKDLLASAGPSQELNAVVRDMERDARSILSTAWPGMEDAAGRLQGTIQTGTPEVIGYDSQWTASDVSRDCRDFSFQARRVLSDAQALVKQTQP
ncbi:MAG: hypothetical protein NTY77_07205 [Elusimicrobia bacterium]|nr:hypothetical protein [Elusimicrobiota bacterium]